MYRSNKTNKSFTHEFAISSRCEWYTPKYIFDAIGLKFDLDPCSPGRKIVPWIPCRKHFTLADNGLTKDWFGKVWLNPPYGKYTGKWIKKLANHKCGIALVFSRTDSKWFREVVNEASLICFTRRLKFVPKTLAKEYAKGTWNVDKDLYLDVNDGKMKRSQTACGSILLAFGNTCKNALLNSKLGICMKTIS